MWCGWVVSDFRQRGGGEAPEHRRDIGTEVRCQGVIGLGGRQRLNEQLDVNMWAERLQKVDQRLGIVHPSEKVRIGHFLF